MRWEDLVAAARERWPIVSRSNGYIEIGVPPNVVRLTALGARVEITAIIAPAVRMPPESALRISGELAWGALCLRDARYLARHVVELEGLDLGELDAAMGKIAYIAADLRRQLCVEPGDGQCFSMYEE